ncbi:MAG: DMT family transporter [Alphaproteobacteria bacterium]|nr:DMT family transporter [Alphaproteobacteria bacterium]
MSEKSPFLIASLYMMGYTIFYAALWACVRYLSGDIHPLVLVFFRTFFGLLTTLPILIRIKLPTFSSGLYPLYILRGVSNIASVAGSYFAIRLLPLADVVAFSYAAPIFATILAAFFLKEHIGRHRVLAILLAFGGVLILIRPGFQNLNEGMWIALGAAACFAVTLICVKTLTRHDSPSMVSLMGFVVALPVIFISALFYWQWPTGEQWAFLILMGLFAAASHLCLARALSRADLSAVMPIDFSRIIFAALLGITLFGDPLNGLTFLGGGVILASAAYAAHRERRNKIAQREMTS